MNQRVALEARMRAALNGADELHFAAAYVKSFGAGKLLRLAPPPGGRAIVGLGFGISDPLGTRRSGSSGGRWRC